MKQNWIFFMMTETRGAGAKLNDMDLIGLPWQVIVGPRGIKSGRLELKNRRSGTTEDLSIETLKQRFLTN